MKTDNVPVRIEYESGNLTTYLYGKIKKSEEMSIEEVLSHLEEWVEFENYSISLYNDGALEVRIE